MVIEIRSVVAWIRECRGITKEGHKGILIWWQHSISWMEWRLHGCLHLSVFHQNCLRAVAVIASECDICLGTVHSKWVHWLYVFSTLLGHFFLKEIEKSLTKFTPLSWFSAYISKQCFWIFFMNSSLGLPLKHRDYLMFHPPCFCLSYNPS